MRYRDWLNLNIHLLWCHNLPVARGRNDAGAVMRSTEYTNSGAWLVREGWAHVEHGNQDHRAKPGQWLIVKPGRRVQSFSADARLISLAFDARWPDGTHLFDKGLSLVVDATDAPDLERHVRPILELMKRVNPDSWDARDHEVDLALFFRIEQLLFRWLVALDEVLAARGVVHSGHSGIDERVRAAIDLMHTCDLAVPLDTEHVAAKVRVSQTHLIRLFHRDLHTTPTRYWDRLRIEHARHRLLQPASRVKEVSIELGFNHLSHFSKWFKRHTGKTPSAMRDGCNVLHFEQNMHPAILDTVPGIKFVVGSMPPLPLSMLASSALPVLFPAGGGGDFSDFKPEDPAARMSQPRTAAIDHVFGRNPRLAAAPAKPETGVPEVERGWPEHCNPDTCARSELCRGSIPSAPGTEMFPFNPSGKYRHPEGWVNYGAAWFISLACLAFDADVKTTPDP